MKIGDTPYTPWIAVDKKCGKIVSAYCTCGWVSNLPCLVQCSSPDFRNNYKGSAVSFLFRLISLQGLYISITG